MSHLGRFLLYGLREHRRSFVHDIAFHKAFRSMLERAVENATDIDARAMLDNFDPVFGVSPDASEMLSQGVCDFVLGRGESHMWFRVGKLEAFHDLDKELYAPTYRELARYLHEALPEESGW